MAGFADAGAGAFGEGVAEFSACFFGFGFEVFDDVGMFVGGVGCFADVVYEIVEFGFVEFAIFVGSGCTAMAAGFASQGSIGVWKLQFPAAIAGDDGLELVDFVVEPVGFVRIF